MKLAKLIVGMLGAASCWYGGVVWEHHRMLAENGTQHSRRILFYQSPMHPWVKSDKPGQCTVCGMDLVAVYENDKNFASGAADIVMLPQGSPNVAGVRTAPVTMMPLLRTLRVSGTIEEDESRHGVISAPVEGRLDGLAMSCEGQQVRQRQPFGTIFSHTLLAAANDYKLALNHDEATAAIAKRRLEQYGLVWEQIKAIPLRQEDDIYFGVLSPRTGTIVKSYVAEGQYVKEGEKLFEIADFTTMWFLFNVDEQDAALIKLGQVVEIQTPSLPGEILKARITFISPNLDERTGSVRVRVEFENPDRRFKNKAYAQGVVETEQPEILAVMRSAVLWPGKIPLVYVEKEAGVYQQREVKLGRAGDEYWEVLSGLAEGERVVTSGNMLIDGQAQLNRIASPASR